MSGFDKEIKSETEFINERGQVVLNNKSGSIVFDENTGSERLQLSHISGANLNFNNKTVSTFAPNNMQDLTNGNRFSTTVGDSFSQTQTNKEERTFGDHTIISGSPNFFTKGLTEAWLEEARDIAVAKAGPEKLYGGQGNNSDVTYPVSGKVAEGSGSVEGGTFATNKAQDNVQQLLEDKAADLSDIEKEMGVGGSIKLLSTKHIVLQAGAKPVSYDSGLIVKNGKSVSQGYIIKDDKLTKVNMSVPVYESKDTSSAVPFGDLQIAAGSKLRASVGSGGISFTSSGDNTFTGTGRTTIGGAEVAIGGSTIGNSGIVRIKSDTDIFLDAGSITTRTAPFIFDNATSVHTFETPQAIFNGNVHIKGNLYVEGEIVAGGDIIAGGRGGVSLLKHTHGGVRGGESNTAKPN
ncbi:hypothetical protein N9Z65_00985 [bacterium]|nr:hypothetical protein [bacterium]